MGVFASAAGGTNGGLRILKGVKNHPPPPAIPPPPSKVSPTPSAPHPLKQDSPSSQLIWNESENESVSHSVISDSLRPHGLWPIRPLYPCNSPGKHTRVGSHSYFRGSFWPRDPTRVFFVVGRFIAIWNTDHPRWFGINHDCSTFPRMNSDSCTPRKLWKPGLINWSPLRPTSPLCEVSSCITDFMFLTH